MEGVATKMLGRATLNLVKVNMEVNFSTGLPRS